MRRATRLVTGWRGQKAKRRKKVDPRIVQAFHNGMKQRLESLETPQEA